MWGGPEDEPDWAGDNSGMGLSAHHEYVTKDSGQKAVHSDGVQRDTNQGKTLFPLMFPKGVPMKDQLIVRLAELYTRGAEKYGDRNWENSKGEDTLEHHLDALWRHFMSFFFEENVEEDHAAAIIWNINAVELTRRNMRRVTGTFREPVEVSALDDPLPNPNGTVKPVCSQCENTWPCRQGCEYAAMVKPQLSESDTAFESMRKACRDGFKDSQAIERAPNDRGCH